MTLRSMARYAAGVVALAASFTGGLIAAPSHAQPKPPQQPAGQAIPHCASEDGGPQQVCIWDSAVDGNQTPAAPNNIVFLYISRPGQDAEGIRLK